MGDAAVLRVQDPCVDRGSGLIRSRRVTPAKVHESEVADDLILGDEQAVHADKAYEKRARREALKARGVHDRIQHRRVRDQPVLPHWQTVRNILIGRIRTAVERTFSELKRGPYGFVRMRCRGLARCSLHFDLAAIAWTPACAGVRPGFGFVPAFRRRFGRT